MSKIIYTKTDEAPALATLSFLPIVKAFTQTAGIAIETTDISVAARVLAEFPEYLSEEQRVPNNLAELGRLTQDPNTNIIKLPNISASVQQLRAAIKELQSKGYAIPDFPDEPKTDEEKEISQRYGKSLGSSVNPVLREGNSDRRAPKAVKNFARKHPHSMGEWKQWSQTHVSHMHNGDFYAGEQSITLDKARSVRMERVAEDGTISVFKSGISLLDKEVIDLMFMSKQALLEFYEREMEDCREAGILFSLHVKATMMKVSHPIVFGHAVKTYYKDAFNKHGAFFDELGINVNNGMASLYEKIAELPASKREEIERDLHACQVHRPRLAMVNSSKGITNFHSPSDVIVDASMPAMIRSGGKMWGADGKMYDCKAVMPESTFARIYQEMINFCKWHGNFDPTTMGTVPNVGLMAQKAEEYGSHDKTFEASDSGMARIVDEETDEVLLEQLVEKGDIWRMCQVKDEPIQDWVKLAVRRARESDTPVIFWLDPYRPHENELIKKVNTYLKDHDTKGLHIEIMSQVRAMRYTLERVARGLDTISATGNILRDYLTDLFPILELGTSAKMLSVVPLMKGGGLFETGAGGSAPKHVQQLLEENHLRWDSLGEFLALTVSLEHLATHDDNTKAQVLADTLDTATEKLLLNNKGPSRKTGEIDNRGSHFYLAMYWAQELAEQDQDADLKAQFAPLAQNLASNEDAIVKEFNEAQGKPVDIKGYYLADEKLAEQVMRPSTLFNDAIASL
ncbi:isocitrate dehydrogenase [Psychrobacter sp. PL15]|uniref:NADP-dependent isocitrate dehydrogenase n=1 Tax=Psychrobacter sp. PL15 TaxID=3071719 RepID=UPI002E057597|nr:isocitrate dehydrogenase [Psychrobacter sp. PL15]